MKRENFDRLVVVSLHTGYCGEDWSALIFLPANTCPDTLAHDMAIEHAESYGHDTEEAWNIEGTCSLFSDASSTTINGFNKDYLYNVLKEAGRVSVDGNNLNVNLTNGFCALDAVQTIADMLRPIEEYNIHIIT